MKRHIVILNSARSDEVNISRDYLSGCYEFNSKNMTTQNDTPDMLVTAVKSVAVINNAYSKEYMLFNSDNKKEKYKKKKYKKEKDKNNKIEFEKHHTKKYSNKIYDKKNHSNKNYSNKNYSKKNHNKQYPNKIS